MTQISVEAANAIIEKIMVTNGGAHEEERKKARETVPSVLDALDSAREQLGTATST